MASSNNVASLPQEGQFLPEVQQLAQKGAWDEDLDLPWPEIKELWEKHWDDKPFKIEKSPPHLIRALEIEEFFVPSYFVVMMRNPYAFCEGYSRRANASLEQSALFWQRCARFQISNVERLQQVLLFTYEGFTQDTASIVKQLQEFLTKIGDLNWQGAFESQSVYGTISRKISNLNDVKISRLSVNDIDSINKVLQSDSSLMNYFDYDFLEGGIKHNLWRLKAQTKFLSVSSWERAKRLYGRRVGKD